MFLLYAEMFRLFREMFRRGVPEQNEHTSIRSVPLFHPVLPPRQPVIFVITGRTNSISAIKVINATASAYRKGGMEAPSIPQASAWQGPSCDLLEGGALPSGFSAETDGIKD
jgi:hypothetical protein